MAYTDRVQDEFTESSDTDLDAHTPTTSGTGWTKVGPAAGGTVQCDATTDSLDCPFESGDLEHRGWRAEYSGSWADDQEAEMDNMDQARISVGLGTRIQDDGAGSADGYFGWHDGGSSQWRISRVDSGSLTNIGNFFDNAPAGSDVIILQSESTTHKLFENGSERISVTDTTYSSGGGPGVFGRRSHSGQGPDNFVGRDQAAAGTANPKGPLGMPLHGPFGGPI